MIDLRYRCVAHEPTFKRGYIGTSWTKQVE
jgi:hypothetical protein